MGHIVARMRLADLIRSAPRTAETERPIWTGETARAEHADRVARARAAFAAEHSQQSAEPVTFWQQVRAMLGRVGNWS